MMVADRVLLFGLLALENRFIDKTQLLGALGNWLADRTKHLDEILVQQGALSANDGQLVARLVERRISSHGNVAASLQSLATVGIVLDDIRQLSSDEDFQTSVSYFPAPAMDTMLPTANSALPSGRRFQIRRPLDRGGLGVVSVAVDNELNREVALKEIQNERADDPVCRGKFLLEAQVTGGLEHPGIVPIYSLGSGPDGRPYYAMRLIRGDNLRIHIRNFHKDVSSGKVQLDGPLLRQLLRRFLDICNAIHYAHSRGVLHRDLKPSNVMIGKYGETLVVDWGLAKPRGTRLAQSVTSSTHPHAEELLDTHGSGDGLTMQGSIVGTAAYAPPEQLSGKIHLVDERSDVYGLGAILYELLTSRPPADGEKLEDVIRCVIAGAIRPPRAILADVPKPLEAICLRALALAPDSRYPSAFDFGRDVENWLDGLPVSAYPEPLSLRLKRWARTHQTLVTTVSASILVTTVGLALFATILGQANSKLASLNEQLDSRNHALDLKNIELLRANASETAARAQAEAQSQLSFSTLTKVVVDVQDELDGIPGASGVRRRLLDMSLNQLEQVASDYVPKAKVDKTNIVALTSLGDLVLRYGDVPTPEETIDHASQATTSLLEKAESFYQRAMEIAIQRQALAPEDVEAQHDLIVAFQRMGSIQTQLGRVNESRNFHQRALLLCQQTLASVPDDSTIKLDFAVCNHQMGSVELQLGQVNETRIFFTKAQETLESLASADPDGLEIQRELGSIYSSTAKFLAFLREPDKAYAYAVRNLEICQSIANSDADSRSSRFSLCASFAELGAICEQSGRFEDALEYRRKNLAISQELSLADPSDTLASETLASAYRGMSLSNIADKEFDESLRFNQLEIEIFQELLNSDPTNSVYLLRKANAFDNKSDTLVKIDQLNEAIAVARKSLLIREDLASMSPEDLQTKRRLLATQQGLGDLLRKAGKPAEAFEQYKFGLALLEEITPIDPKFKGSVRHLAPAYARTHDVATELDSIDDMIRFSEKLCDVNRILYQADPTNERKRRALWESLYDLGCEYGKKHESEKAKSSFSQAKTLVTELISIKGRSGLSLRSLKMIDNELAKIESQSSNQNP